MEPLPVQQEEESRNQGAMETLPHATIRERARRDTSRRSGRTNPQLSAPGGASEAELGLDWFQGELLLESDEDDSERGNKDSYAV